MFCLRTCSIANYLLEKLRKFCRYLFTKSNGNFTSCLWSSISELMCNIKEITYNTDVVLVDEMQLPKKAPKGCLSNLRIIFRTNFYDKCVCWYSSENLTDYEMWLLPLWCYAVGPIHSKRPCKYYDNPCEYHEVNNPMLLFNNLPMITMANCVKTTFAELSSHFLPLWDSLHYCSLLASALLYIYPYFRSGLFLLQFIQLLHLQLKMGQVKSDEWSQ